MVRAWYMDEESTDQRLEHHKTPPEFLTLDELFKKTGVEYFKLNPVTYATDGVLDEIKRKRGYTYEDESTCAKELVPNFEEIMKIFYEEHLHTHEEIRFILDGRGYFDVRDVENKWVRIEVVGGDMVILPSGSYHRLTLDTNNYIKGKRLFAGEPEWHAYNRPSDDMECRKTYLDKLNKGFGRA